jgi:drug/metabolite transporter (DMT)-like permease
VVALLGWLVLGEKVSLLRWAGIAVICLGVFVVSRTGAQTTKARKTGAGTAGAGPAGQLPAENG